MGYTKDLWTKPARNPGGKVKTDDKGNVVREPNTRWGKGKRWLACWDDPDGNEVTKAFVNKIAATKHWQGQAADVERGDYIDRKAGKGTLDGLARQWLAAQSRKDPATVRAYESAYRVHVKPKFGAKPVGAIRPSQIQTFLTGLPRATAIPAKIVLAGAMDLALADGAIKTNPARSKIVTVEKATVERVQAWPDDWVFGIIDAHPEHLRVMPLIGANCGLRIGEQFGLALEDVDFEKKVIHVRRQIKRLDRSHVFALPKYDKERDVPLGDSMAEEIRAHIKRYKPMPCMLPWEKPDGKPRTHNILFRWSDGKHVRRTAYDSAVWKPALVAAGVIPKPEYSEGRRKRPLYLADRKHGSHQFRHWYASVQLADGVNIRELAEYLGHVDPGFTLRVYTHMTTTSHDRSRKATDRRMATRVLAAHPDLADLEEHVSAFYDGASTEQGVEG